MTSHDAVSAEALAARCLDLLRSAGHTVATAESLTAGLVSATLAGVPGASDVLRGGLVAYAGDVKTSVLGVDDALVATYGVVSAECALAMAHGGAALLGSTWGVATTGVAGPDRQEDKPVGTVYVAVCGPGVEQVRPLALGGSRRQIRLATVVEALALLGDSTPGPDRAGSTPGDGG
jgi:nicotinamide-nucleotide amidase